MIRAIFLIGVLFTASAGFSIPSSAAQKNQIYICTMDDEVKSSKPGQCPKCGMKLVAQSSVKGQNAEAGKSESSKVAGNATQDDVQANKSIQADAGKTLSPATQTTESSDEEYTCSMHPEVRAKTKGKCPKCAMALISVNPAVADEFVLRMEASPAAPKPAEKVRLKFSIFNPKTGALVKDFALLHEKLFHLFVVSQDLTQFQHIHPRLNTDGSFSIDTVLPQAGRYKIYCDFYPVEGSPQVLQQNISTYGYREDLFAARPKIIPETVYTKIVEGEKITEENAENVGVSFSTLKAKPLHGLRVDLKITPPQIIAGKPAELKYHLTDAKTGEAIKDLSPYLGAWGHTLILSEDQTGYVHSHPVELPPNLFDLEEIDESKFFGGPEVTFEAMFPEPGNYKIWTQFLRGDTLTTVTFTVRAERLR
jgi:ssDNA-binding Zn-finger/Zn-ribbon topoisomerase 1